VLEVREHVLNKLHKYVSGAPLMHVKYFTVFAMFGADRDKTVAPKVTTHVTEMFVMPDSCSGKGVPGERSAPPP
jgi:hypothetical protein